MNPQSGEGRGLPPPARLKRLNLVQGLEEAAVEVGLVAGDALKDASVWQRPLAAVVVRITKGVVEGGAGRVQLLASASDSPRDQLPSRGAEVVEEGAKTFAKDSGVPVREVLRAARWIGARHDPRERRGVVAGDHDEHGCGVIAREAGVVGQVRELGQDPPGALRAVYPEPEVRWGLLAGQGEIGVVDALDGDGDLVRFVARHTAETPEKAGDEVDELLLQRPEGSQIPHQAGAVVLPILGPLAAGDHRGRRPEAVGDRILAHRCFAGASPRTGPGHRASLRASWQKL